MYSRSERYSLLELVARLAEICGGPSQAHHAPPRPGDVPHSQADISLARRKLGYEPAVAFATGLAKTTDWLGSRI